MHEYEAKKFDLPSLDGISDESVKQHIGLYEGYVKNLNDSTAELWNLVKSDAEKNSHAISELARRRSFEFDGMRLHEYYFRQFEGGAQMLDQNGTLATSLAETYGSLDMALQAVRSIAMMRGPGWSILYFDAEAKTFQLGFVGEQHQGHFAALPIILALDVWEHAFLLDYGAQGKGKYVDAFCKNLNWSVVEKRFTAALM